MNSCYYDEFPEEIIVEIPDIPETQVVSFSTEIQPIFALCTSCHTSSNTLNLTVGNSYNQLVPKYVVAGDANSSILYNKIPGKDHPIQVAVSNEPSVDQLALIKAWINQGAKNN